MKKFIKEWIIPVIAAICIAFLIHNFLFYFVEIPSVSMVPTLNVDDRLIVTRVYDYDNLKRGDIIVFHSDELNQRLIKRLIGLPGDHIEITKGVVSVNGEVLPEEYVKNNGYEEEKLVYDIPEDKYFFLGDNRPNSLDARYWKNPYIDKKSIEGKAKFKVYPFRNFGKLK